MPRLKSWVIRMQAEPAKIIEPRRSLGSTIERGANLDDFLNTLLKINVVLAVKHFPLPLVEIPEY
jgi:hypothetical protein